MRTVDKAVIQILQEGWISSLDLHDNLQKLLRTQGKMGWLSRLCYIFGLDKYSRLFQIPSLNTMYAAIDRLEKSGKMQTRWREEPTENLTVRCGIQRREHYLGF
jgi:hypothetical protein